LEWLKQFMQAEQQPTANQCSKQLGLYCVPCISTAGGRHAMYPLLLASLGSLCSRCLAPHVPLLLLPCSYVDANNLVRDDLYEGMTTASAMFVAHTINAFEAVKSLHIILLVVTLCLLLGFVIILFRPYLTRLHAESKAIAGGCCSLACCTLWHVAQPCLAYALDRTWSSAHMQCLVDAVLLVAYCLLLHTEGSGILHMLCTVRHAFTDCAVPWPLSPIALRPAEPAAC
jgi:hypothetical protein